MSEAFDISDRGFFARFAPERPQLPALVWNNETFAPPPDDLARLAREIRTSLAFAGACILRCGAIIRRRIALWCDTHILRSLPVAWAMAGVNAGGFAGLILIQLYL